MEKKCLVEVKSLLDDSVLKNVSFNTKNGDSLSTGELYQVVAKVKSGKTLFCTELCNKLISSNKDMGVLFVDSGDETYNTFFSRLVAVSYLKGSEASVDDVFKLLSNIMLQRYESVDQEEDLTNHIGMMQENNGRVAHSNSLIHLLLSDGVGIDGFESALAGAVEESGCKVVILDGIDRVCSIMSTGKKVSTLVNITNMLKRFALKHNVLVITTIQAREYSMDQPTMSLEGVNPYAKCIDDVVDGTFYL